MRSVLVILGVAVLLLGPLNEWTHHHAPGAPESGCVACQAHHAAAEPPAAPRGLATAPPTYLEVERSRPALRAAADPLRVAPKTSPPPWCRRT